MTSSIASRTPSSFHAPDLQICGELLTGVVDSLLKALVAKDRITGEHSRRVAAGARQIAGRLGLAEAECRQIESAGLLHDIGKIGIPDRVLQKTTSLNDQERELIRQHPVIGCEILAPVRELADVLPGVLHHHEAIDGSGYPHGLEGESIPLAGRILAVADAWDAMTNNRTYRNGLSEDEAATILRRGAGTQWDPACVDALFEVRGFGLPQVDGPHDQIAAPWLQSRARRASQAPRIATRELQQR